MILLPLNEKVAQTPERPCRPTAVGGSQPLSRVLDQWNFEVFAGGAQHVVVRTSTEQINCDDGGRTTTPASPLVEIGRE